MLNINRVGSFDIVGSYLVGKFSDRNSIWFYHCQYSFDDDPSFSKITQHISELKNSPAPDIAVMYYTGSDLYLFENLYDVFVNIRDDEAEHCKTMRAISGCVVSEEAHCEGIVDCIKKNITN
ncbi:hypothetical protein HID58_012474 [Brassica napus]|uniref:Ubiquinol oxidase n=1 Tax=Brassica napus TaxID=3708 RepID=A0ABQ8E156_BRANA|nr:hypothetical protein HID58_012474 [Brassica napus]